MSGLITSFLGVKASILQGSAAGGVISAIMGQGPWWRRALNGFGGALTAVYVTPLLLAILSKFIDITHEIDRSVAFGIGIVGMTMCEGFMIAVTRVKDRSKEITDKAIDKHFDKE